MNIFKLRPIKWLKNFFYKSQEIQFPDLEFPIDRYNVAHILNFPPVDINTFRM